jgi:cytochrome b6-f complex iron-sulfur subunit
MDRREFLSVLGMGTAAVACSYCLGGCKTEDAIVNAPTNVDFTLDLTNPAYAALKNNGGYIYNGGVIVARIADGSYVAVSQACTHQGTTVVYDLGSNQFYCQSHGSMFSTTGAVTRGPAGSPLMAYKTTLTGNSLRVFS